MWSFYHQWEGRTTGATILSASIHRDGSRHMVQEIAPFAASRHVPSNLPPLQLSLHSLHATNIRCRGMYVKPCNESCGASARYFPPPRRAISFWNCASASSGCALASDRQPLQHRKIGWSFTTTLKIGPV